MAKLIGYIRRSTAIMKMPEAIERGLTVSAFRKELDASTGSYRWTRMMADWRSVAGIEAKKDVAKYIRRDRLPSVKAVADVEWELSKEYMYKLKVTVRAAPDKPLTERFVNIMHDRLLSPAQIEEQVQSQWPISDSQPAELPTRIVLVGIYHRIESPLE